MKAPKTYNKTDQPVDNDQTTFTGDQVKLLTDDYILQGNITAEQGQEVTSALAEKGPQEAIQKLNRFLLSLDK